MENDLLNAVSYIKSAMGKIQTIEQFFKYKEEINKALLDLETGLNIMRSEKSEEREGGERKSKEIKEGGNDGGEGGVEGRSERSGRIVNLDKITNDCKNSSAKSLSSMLGLRYNYDEYLKDKEEVTSLKPKDLNKCSNNVIEGELISKALPALLNEVDKSPIRKEGTSEEEIVQSNYKLAEKSLRYQISNNTFINKDSSQKEKDGDIKRLINEYSKDNGEQGKENNPPHKEEHQIKVDYVQKPAQNIHHFTSGRKEKISYITDLIMKINSDDYYMEILSKLFGADFMEKLMSSKVEEQFLEQVEESMKEIEKLKEKDKEKEREMRLLNENNINTNNDKVKDIQQEREQSSYNTRHKYCESIDMNPYNLTNNTNINIQNIKYTLNNVTNKNDNNSNKYNISASIGTYPYSEMLLRQNGFILNNNNKEMKQLNSFLNPTSSNKPPHKKQDYNTLNLSHQINSNSHKTHNLEMNHSDPYNEFNFEKSLRSDKTIINNIYNNSGNKSFKEEEENNLTKIGAVSMFRKRNSSKTVNNSGFKHEKPFISVTSSYGRYFDDPLQKGGFSKIPVYKNSFCSNVVGKGKEKKIPRPASSAKRQASSVNYTKNILNGLNILTQ